MTAEATNTLVAAAIVSITVNPLLYRGIGPFLGWLTRRGGTRAAGRLAERAAESEVLRQEFGAADSTGGRPSAVVIGRVRLAGPWPAS